MNRRKPHVTVKEVEDLVKNIKESLTNLDHDCGVNLNDTFDRFRYSGKPTSSQLKKGLKFFVRPILDRKTGAFVNETAFQLLADFAKTEFSDENPRYRLRYEQFLYKLDKEGPGSAILFFAKEIYPKSIKGASANTMSIKGEIPINTSKEKELVAENLNKRVARDLKKPKLFDLGFVFGGGFKKLVSLIDEAEDDEAFDNHVLQLYKYRTTFNEYLETQIRKANYTKMQSTAQEFYSWLLRIKVNGVCIINIDSGLGRKIRDEVFAMKVALNQATSMSVDVSEEKEYWT